MKLSEIRAPAPEEELEEPLPYPCSELADPPITAAEARAVDLGRDTTVCRWHRGQHTHLNVDGHVYFCPIWRMYWRYIKQPSGSLKRCTTRKLVYRQSAARLTLAVTADNCESN